MNGPRENYALWNKSDRERQIFYAITYTWNLKNKTNVYNKTEIDSQREQTSCYQWGEGRREGHDKGRGLKHKLLCIKQISNKDILNSTGKYSHCFVITLSGV